MRTGRSEEGPGWKAKFDEHGSCDVKCDNWLAFNDYVNSKLTRFRSYIFRGQAKSDWKLKSTLDRRMPDADIGRYPGKRWSQIIRARDEHLEAFKYAARGRRGPSPAKLETDDEWWALGQHFGLATPLLDWSESPYVAAYFAFCDEGQDSDGFAAIYGLSRGVIERRVKELSNELEERFDPGDMIRFVSPLADDNARLINQRGLFTLSPAGQCVRDWVRTYFNDTPRCPFIKILIPRNERTIALRSLNRMNVNPLTLFPDLDGASDYCNKKLMDYRY